MKCNRKISSGVLCFLSSLLCFTTTIWGKEYFITHKEVQGEQYVSLDNQNWLSQKQINAFLMVNGELIPDIYPIIQDGVSLVPLRVVSEHLGAQVAFTSTDKPIIISYPEKAIQLTVGNKTVYVNNATYTLTVAPQIINNRTYVPARFVAEAMGFQIDYTPNFVTFPPTTLQQHNIPLIAIQYAKTDVTWMNTKVVDASPNYKIKPFDAIQMQSDATLIFTNFPEVILNNSFLETYSNQTEVTGKGRIFISQFNRSGVPIDYILRFENTTNAPMDIFLTKDFKIQTTEPYTDQIVTKNDQDFYKKRLNNETELHTLQPGEQLDMVLENIQDKKFFSGLVDFYSTQPVLVTTFVMAQTDLTIPAEQRYTSIPTPTKPYDYNYVPLLYQPETVQDAGIYGYYTVYSGHSNGFNLETHATIAASEFDTTGVGIGFETGGLDKNMNERHGIHEIFDIFLVDPRGENNEITKATWVLNIPYTEDTGNWKRNRPRNYGNLGNWGVDYNMSTMVQNDSNEDKLFTCYLVAPFQSTVNILTPENNIYTSNINNNATSEAYQRTAGKLTDTISLSTETKKLKIAEVFLKAGESKKINYTYVLGTDCDSTIFHVWDCAPAPVQQ